MTNSEVLLLDACACINLAAVRPLKHLEEDLGRPIRILTEAAKESLFLHRWVNGKREQVAIQLDAIPTLDLQAGAELELYVRLAQRLGDGEAASLSLSHHRGVQFVTDDRAARRVAEVEAPQARIVGSAGVIRSQIAAMSLPPSEIAKVLRRVEMEASFRPPSNDPDFTWWIAALEHARTKQ